MTKTTLPSRPVKVKNKIHIGGYAFDIVNTTFLVLCCALVILPFMRVIAISLSSSRMIDRGSVGIWPIELNLRGYEIVFGNVTIYRSYGWTLLYSGLFTIITVSMTACLAYPLSVSDFVLKKPISVLLLITMFFSGGTVPSYLLIKNLGLMNTPWALVLPGAVGAWNTFLYRSFFKGISHEIREAALIDGAGDFRILVKIILPLSKALIATFSLFAIVGQWNSYFAAMLYIKDATKFPIQNILRSIVYTSVTATFGDAGMAINQGAVNPLNVQYACLIATIAPLLIIYPFIQKYFESGMQVGAVKG
ncbi:MAG: carbohydrate ABC transporter permease [Clostridiales bacterium]|nr:carbohydrate ABC transporter permease [Clostridiales bacterium]